MEKKEYLTPDVVVEQMVQVEMHIAATQLQGVRGDDVIFNYRGEDLDGTMEADSKERRDDDEYYVW